MAKRSPAKPKNKIIFNSYTKAIEWFEKNHFRSIDGIFWYKQNSLIWSIFIEQSITARFFKNKTRSESSKIPVIPPKQKSSPKKRSTKKPKKQLVPV